MSANVSKKNQRVGMHGSGLPMPRDLGVGEHPASGSLQGKGRQGKRHVKNKNWWEGHTRACTHARTRAHTHRGFEFDEIPESDKEEFAEWLEGIRSAEEEQEQEQLEQQQVQELKTDQQGQNSMDMQRSGSDRGEDTEGGVFEEHIS